MIGDVCRIWSMSGAVYEGKRPFDLVRRGKFVGHSLSVYSALKPLLKANPETVLGKLLRERPETIGIVVWPYQCASWDASTRLHRLAKHCDAVASFGKPIDLGANDRIVLADLNSIREDLRVVLDQPSWFMREGNLVVNLFVGRVRMYSLAFSLYEDKSGLTAVVGALQGRDIESALEEYKNLTKAAHGMRPRDLLFEIFCMLCSVIAVRNAMAVSEEARHHKHPYFQSRTESKKPSTNYNQIWEERNARRLDRSFYSLDILQNRRDLEAVPAKKRGMYRRRYEMLDEIKNQVSETIQAAKVSPIFEPHERFDL